MEKQINKPTVNKKVADDTLHLLFLKMLLKQAQQYQLTKPSKHGEVWLKMVNSMIGSPNNKENK